MNSNPLFEDQALRETLADSPIRIEFGADRVDALGDLARQQGATRALLVTDAGIVAAGHVARAVSSLEKAGMHARVFDGACENPTTREVELGLALARETRIDAIIAIGGGSAMDCAKGVNLLYANGGQMRDFRGDPDLQALALRKPALPMILAPTTTGTGSEAQSFALISDAETHQKMPCGDRRPPRQGGLRPRVALLDPNLARTQPRGVLAAAGVDALVHSIETAGSTRRNPHSRRLSSLAWKRLSTALPRALKNQATDDDWGDLLLGAHLAGAAIEASMLGAAHACANPLTANFDVTHGVAVGLMTPHVVRFNTANGSNPYGDLSDDAGALAAELESVLGLAGFPTRLREMSIPESALTNLATQAAQQWTATFNPRAVTQDSLFDLYRAAY